MKLGEDEVRRLGFIRHLFKTGVEQSHEPRPLCAKSILTFHDAVELYLNLVAEHFELRPNGFMSHWNQVKQSPDIDPSPGRKAR